MKKQKSFTNVLSEFSSSDDESEKAMPKIDKEELRKYLKDSDEESSQDQFTPKRPKNIKRLKTPPIEGSPIIKPKKVISEDPSQKYLVQGNNFKKLQKKAKKLGASSLDYSKRKNYKYIIEYDNNMIYSSDTNKFSTIFKVKGKKEVKPLEYKDKYFNTKMAIIFDSIYLGRSSVSIQVKAHEVHILPFEERKSILKYKENEDDVEYVEEVESENEDEYYENDEVFE